MERYELRSSRKRVYTTSVDVSEDVSVANSGRESDHYSDTRRSAIKRTNNKRVKGGQTEKLSQPATATSDPFEKHLIQESLHDNLFDLLVQAILWNQTRGLQARPILYKLLELYPDAASLAQADVKELTDLLQPIGLHNIRAKRLIAFAQAWNAAPPNTERRYRRMNYPKKGDGRGIPGGVLEPGDIRDGWEVAHLPGIGEYALDSYRMFYRDRLRGLSTGWNGEDSALPNFEPEWKRVNPKDKDLKAFIVMLWRREGFAFNDGKLTPLGDTLKQFTTQTL